MDAINVLMYFVVVTLLFQLLAKHSSAALPCRRFVNHPDRLILGLKRAIYCR